MTNLEPPAPPIRRLPLLAVAAPAAAGLAAVGMLELHNVSPVGNALLIAEAPLAVILTVRPPWRIALGTTAVGAILAASVYIGGIIAILTATATALILGPCIKPTTRWIRQTSAFCRNEPDVDPGGPR